MIRVAIIGCGRIADQHVQAIHRIPGCQVVAVCDREVLMAEQLAERFEVKGSFSEVSSMLRTATPDVVHITTPPQGHFTLAKECLEAGAHVYLEKPFTVTGDEAASLVELARKCKREITAGHNYQFTPEMCEMRKLVKEGFLGGDPVHLESHFSYDLSDSTYVGPLLGSRNHWVRQLPGQLLHNIISHGIAKLAEFLDDDITSVVAHAEESPRMLELGGKEVFDELRVMIRDAKGTTAFFCFSSRIKPGVNQLRVYGPKNSLFVDQGCGSVIRVPARTDRSYLTYFLPPFRMAREHRKNGWRNVFAFLGRRLFQDFGMTDLIRRFYGSFSSEGMRPIPYREIVLTARLMDMIFEQVYGSSNEAPLAYQPCTA